jgi:hypothetical protein
LNSPFIILLYPPPPFPGVVATGFIVAFTNMCAHYLHHIHPPTPFPHHLGSHCCQPSLLGRTCFALLFSNFIDEKKRKDKMKNMTF